MGGIGGLGGVVRVYSNEGKDGDILRGLSFMFYCFMVSMVIFVYWWLFFIVILLLFLIIEDVF